MNCKFLFIPILIILHMSAFSRELIIQDGHKDTVTAVLADNAGKHLISGSKDAAVKVWDLHTGRLIFTLRDHTDAITCLALDQTGKYILSGSLDKCIKIWNRATRTLLRTIRSSAAVHSLALDSSNRIIISAHRDNSIKIWDLATGKNTKTINTEKAAGFPVQSVNQLVVDPAGEFCACIAAGPAGPGPEKTAVLVINFKTGRLLKNLKGHKAPVRLLALDKTGAFLTAGSEDNIIRTWDCTEWKETASWPGGDNRITSLLPDDGGQALVLADTTGMIRIREKVSGKIINRINTGKQPVNCLAMGPAAELIIAGYADRDIGLWYKTSGVLDKTLAGAVDVFSSILYLPDRQQVATGMQTGEIKTWDLATGKLVHRLQGHSGAVRTLAVNGDTSWLISGSDDRSIRIWNLSAGKPVNRLTAHKGAVNVLSLDTIGRLLASASDDDTIRIWDLLSGKLLKTMTLDQDAEQQRDNTADISRVHSLLFGPSGEFLSAGPGGIHSWDVRTGYYMKIHYPGLTPATALACDPGWEYLITGDLLGQVMIREYNSGRIKKMIAKAHDSGIARLRVSENGRRLYSAGADGRIKIWSLPGGEQEHTFPVTIRAVTDFIFPDEHTAISIDNGPVMRLQQISSEENLGWVTRDNDWLIYTAAGYFRSSPGGAALLAMASPSGTLGMDLLSLRNNRPDLVLARLPFADRAVTDYYAALYRDRKAAAGFSSPVFTPAISLPVISIRQINRQDSSVEIVFDISDTGSAWQSYNVYRNGSPLFPFPGRSANRRDAGQSGQSKVITEQVELLPGNNRIEIACVNSAGVKSMRTGHFFTYRETGRPDLYFISFALSSYENDNLDVKYIHQDAIDLSRYFYSLRTAYAKRLTRNFLDHEAIYVNAAGITAFADQAGWKPRPEDTIILYLGGYSYLDAADNPAPYFLLHNTDQNNIGGTAVPLPVLVDFIKNTKPHNKLIIADIPSCCELNDGAREMAASLAPGLRPRLISAGDDPVTGYTPVMTRPVRSCLNDRDFYFFHDPFYDDGVIIFSSCRWGEISFESSQLKNGLFTEALLSALSQKAADKDQNGQLSMVEIRDYVYNQVATASEGQQNPVMLGQEINREFSLPAANQ